MIDQIRCSKCHKINGIYRFCIHCGEYLLSDNEIKLINENPDPYCLNCGRPVKKGQSECECGNEFGDIHCHNCNTLNEYTNKFCISCGKKLWTSDVLGFKYSSNFFEKHFDKHQLPSELQHTALFKRLKHNIGKNPVLDQPLRYFLKNALKLDDFMDEIGSRWKIVSPNYCIKCLNILNPSEFSCCNCKCTFADKTRVDFIKTHDYIKPKFDNVELKWTSKNSRNYFSSLSPAFGESQFEYRERLKWEFAETNHYYHLVLDKYESKKKKMEFEKLTWVPPKKQTKPKEIIEGGYCGAKCRHYYERWLDSGGGETGSYSSMSNTEYYCYLGHSLHEGSYCDDYRR